MTMPLRVSADIHRQRRGVSVGYPPPTHAIEL